MAVISVRLNEDEEKIIEYLSKTYSEDKSTLIKHSLRDLYEDSIDLDFVRNYDSSEKEEDKKFINGEDIINKM